MELDNSKRKKIILTILMSLIGIVVIVGISYAYILFTAKQKISNLVTSSCVKVEIEDITDAIYLEDVYPISDADGLKTNPYTFKVTNKCNVGVDYQVNLDVLDSENRIASKNIAIKFSDMDKQLLSAYEDVTDDTLTEAVERRKLVTGSLSAKESVTYSLQLWLDENAGNDAQDGIFESKIVVLATQTLTAYYSESLLNGADPIVSDNLIAVNIADDGTVTKANVKEKWYSYQDKEWANAVILKDESITYADGDKIPEDNIESYFVWIPKYSYQLWDLGEYDSLLDSEPNETSAHTIPIKFGTFDTNDDNDGECTTPLISGETGNCAVGDYMTHPAFINSGTNGLWVGKFETGYDGATTTSDAQVSSPDSTKIIVKPNVYSWRSNTVYNFFMASYNYNRNLDSHMMKNTEWGAVAYLSYSKYGINDEIWINNNSNYVTGCVGDSVSASSYNGCANAYNTTTGYKGSTTGNITGIYDMSGGAWEYVAAYIDGKTSSSGFSTTSGDLTTYAKYLDVYNASSDTNTYNYRILGDATGEMGPFYKIGSSYYNNWFQDPSGFVSSSDPWFNRGAGYSSGTNAGRFNFSRSNGSADSLGTRLVLAV
jgi:hypothetical protein